MAQIREINLKQLFDSGDIVVTAATAEHASSDGIASMFDDDETSTSLNLNSVFVAGFKIEFPRSLKTLAGAKSNDRIKIEIKTERATAITFDINTPTATLEGLAGAFTGLDNSILNTSTNTIREDIEIIHIYAISDVNNPAFNITNLAMFIENVPNFEFNDSVLTTKAWNSSRYDGRQLSAQKINKATIDDIGNNNKIPIIRNYTRNIYIGNEIVGMSETSPEDPTLVQFPDFSYAQINSYITVNEDGTITNNILNPEENTDIQKRTFYRPFVRDFAEGSFCNFILGDPTIKNNLKPKYPIYFNGGQLKKIVQLLPNPDDSSSSNILLITSASLTGGNILQGTSYTVSDPNKGSLYIGGNLSGDVINTTYTSSINNTDLYRDFYTGSLIDREDNKVELFELQTFTETLGASKATSTYKNNKRLFATACQATTKDNIEDEAGGNGRPLYRFEDLGIEELKGPDGTGAPFDLGFGAGSQSPFKGTGVNIIELPTLATFEIETSGTTVHTQGSSTTRALQIPFNNRYTPKQTYYSGQKFYLDGITATLGASLNTPGFGKDLLIPINPGSIVLSINDDNVPSILVPLKKEKDLPNDKGNKPFIVIPENLHPYVKDNIIFYLSKAGIDIGGDATNKVKENNNKRIGKKRILTEAQLKGLARKRLEARLSRTLLGRRRLRQEDRQNRREERREERRENRNERLKERNNRRENRSINKNNKKENRRQNRRNRRRRR